MKNREDPEDPPWLFILWPGIKLTNWAAIRSSLPQGHLDVKNGFKGNTVDD